MERKIKFLINIPLKVESEDRAKFICQYLLKNLEEEGFRREDYSPSNIAVIFGLNGKHSPELRKILDCLENFDLEHPKIKCSKITFTWGEGGDTAQKPKDNPYQHIREYLKNHGETRRLVHELKQNDDNALIYFSFIDSDTLHFKQTYSEYLQIVRKEISNNGIPPTVMSTGYKFDTGSVYHTASWHDLQVRVITAKHFPLGTYYPEPNFCVQVPGDEDHVPESFINPDRKNMESPILISRVKNRTPFKAVFTEHSPTIIDVPQRFRLFDRGLGVNQSHFYPRMWAVGACLHGELKHREPARGIAGRNRKYLMDLLKCKNDDEFQSMSNENPFTGPGAELVIKAAQEVREFLKVIYELDESFPSDPELDLYSGYDSNN